MADLPLVLIADATAPETVKARVDAAWAATDGGAGDIAMPRVVLIRSPEALTDEARAATVLMAPPDLAAALLPHLPELRWVQSTWAGVTPILRARAALPVRRRPVVTAAKGLFGPRMADYVFGWLLALERRILDYEALKQAGTWRRLPWRDLQGRTLLLIGTGTIGCHLAAVAPLFGLHTCGVSRRGHPAPPISRVYGVERLHEALSTADYVVASLPDTPATRHLLDASAFAAMRDDAILINVGRGTLIDDDALVAAVQSGRPRAAVLDVFHEEPLPPDHPFWRTPGIHLTPHVAAFTPQDGIVRLFADNLRAYVSGGTLAGEVDPEAGY